MSDAYLYFGLGYKCGSSFCTRKRPIVLAKKSRQTMVDVQMSSKSTFSILHLHILSSLEMFDFLHQWIFHSNIYLFDRYTKNKFIYPTVWKNNEKQWMMLETCEWMHAFMKIGKWYFSKMISAFESS